MVHIQHVRILGYSTAQGGMVRYGVVRYVMVCYVMVHYGMVWSGTVWKKNAIQIQNNKILMKLLNSKKIII